MTTLPDPSLVILYVENVALSTKFYADLLRRLPVESAPTFAMFSLSSGLMLGLWGRTGVDPKATLTGGGGELCLKVADIEAVREAHADWVARGFKIIQPPTQMDFGHTFVGCDPDGHRLRVYFPTV